MRFETHLFRLHSDNETPLADVLLKDGVLRTLILNDSELLIHLEERGIELKNHKVKTQYLSRLFGIKRSEGHLISPIQLTTPVCTATASASSSLISETLKNQIHKCATLQYTISTFSRFSDQQSIQKISNSPPDGAAAISISNSQEQEFLEHFIGCKIETRKTTEDSTLFALSLLLPLTNARSLHASLNDFGLRCGIQKSRIEKSLYRILISPSSVKDKLKALRAPDAEEEKKMASSSHNYAALPYGIFSSNITGTPVYIGLGDWHDRRFILDRESITDLHTHIFLDNNLSTGAQPCRDHSVTLFLEAHGNKENKTLTSAHNGWSVDPERIGKLICKLYPDCRILKVHLLSCHGSGLARRALANSIATTHANCTTLHITARDDVYHTLSHQDTTAVTRDIKTKLFTYTIDNVTKSIKKHTNKSSTSKLVTERQQFNDHLKYCQAFYKTSSPEINLAIEQFKMRLEGVFTVDDLRPKSINDPKNPDDDTPLETPVSSAAAMPSTP